jgi:hypothetical protein
LSRAPATDDRQRSHPEIGGRGLEAEEEPRLRDRAAGAPGQVVRHCLGQVRQEVVDLASIRRGHPRDDGARQDDEKRDARQQQEPTWALDPHGHIVPVTADVVAGEIDL